MLGFFYIILNFTYNFILNKSLKTPLFGYLKYNIDIKI